MSEPPTAEAFTSEPGRPGPKLDPGLPRAGRPCHGKRTWLRHKSRVRIALTARQIGQLQRAESVCFIGDISSLLSSSDRATSYGVAAGVADFHEREDQHSYG